MYRAFQTNVAETLEGSKLREQEQLLYDNTQLPTDST